MAAPLGAIIQAIDHAMERMHDGASAGIQVAASQNGVASTKPEPIKNETEEVETVESKVEELPTEAEGAENILSDEKAKSSVKLSLQDSNVSSGKKAGGASTVLDYAAGLSQGIANAGAIATGNNKASFDYKDSTAKAKQAAEDTIKKWTQNRQDNGKKVYTVENPHPNGYVTSLQGE